MKTQPLLRLLEKKFPNIPEKELFARIFCGEVKVNGERIRFPDKNVSVNAVIEFQLKKYVSRGGYKLEKVFEEIGDIAEGKTFIDAGSSTGGFTDCLLKHGAALVHAVDVGYNQLDYKLRKDTRVIVHERTNIMDIHSLDPHPDSAVADLSFRSIISAARHIFSLIKENWLVALIKPQFELQNPPNDFDGIIRSKEALQIVLNSVVQSLYKNSLFPKEILLSPVPGRKGNREFFFRIYREIQEKKDVVEKNISSLINKITELD